MKKMLKNQKGFSLIELLIVIAIMGVLAVIAFSMFSGVVANSRKKADNTQAGNIQKALVAYIVDTGDAKIESLNYGDVGAGATEGDGGTQVADGNSWDKVVLALQRKQRVDNKVYEPYLNPKSGTTPSSIEFDVQWSEHEGYKIEVYPERMNAVVEPVTVVGDAVLNIN